MLPEFVQRVQDLIDESIRGIHTAMPGTIVSYDPSTGLASVQPALKYRKPDGETMDYPRIPGVPVLLSQSFHQRAAIGLPIHAGDGCLLIASEQSTDYWLYGQETDTDLPFDLTDSICIPGLFPAANPVEREACEEDALILDLDGSRISLKDGGVHIEGPVTIEGFVTIRGEVVLQEEAGEAD